MGKGGRGEIALKQTWRAAAAPFYNIVNYDFHDFIILLGRGGAWVGGGGGVDRLEVDVEGGGGGGEPGGARPQAPVQQRRVPDKACPRP